MVLIDSDLDDARSPQRTAAAAAAAAAAATGPEKQRPSPTSIPDSQDMFDDVDNVKSGKRECVASNIGK